MRPDCDTCGDEGHVLVLVAAHSDMRAEILRPPSLVWPRLRSLREPFAGMQQIIAHARGLYYGPKAMRFAHKAISLIQRGAVETAPCPDCATTATIEQMDT